MIKKEHVAQVAEMSGEFKAYLDEVHDESESTRAYKDNLRADNFGEEEQEDVFGSESPYV